jgi:hypothetical protein
MDLYRELSRITEPPPAASKVRSLTPDEIKQLMATGQITPVEQIPELHTRPRIHFPRDWGRGTYGFGK